MQKDYLDGLDLLFSTVPLGVFSCDTYQPSTSAVSVMMSLLFNFYLSQYGTERILGSCMSHLFN